MCVGLHRLTQAGPENPGQPYTHTALLHKIEGKEQRAEKKVAFFKELTTSFFLRLIKTKKKFFYCKVFFPFVLHVPVYHLLYSKNPYKEPVF